MCERRGVTFLIKKYFSSYFQFTPIFATQQHAACSLFFFFSIATALFLGTFLHFHPSPFLFFFCYTSPLIIIITMDSFSENAPTQTSSSSISAPVVAAAALTFSSQHQQETEEAATISSTDVTTVTTTTTVATTDAAALAPMAIGGELLRFAEAQSKMNLTFMQKVLEYQSSMFKTTIDEFKSTIGQISENLATITTNLVDECKRNREESEKTCISFINLTRDVLESNNISVKRRRRGSNDAITSFSNRTITSLSHFSALPTEAATSSRSAEATTAAVTTKKHSKMDIVSLPSVVSYDDARREGWNAKLRHYLVRLILSTDSSNFSLISIGLNVFTSPDILKTIDGANLVHIGFLKKLGLFFTEDNSLLSSSSNTDPTASGNIFETAKSSIINLVNFRIFLDYFIKNGSKNHRVRVFDVPYTQVFDELECTSICGNNGISWSNFVPSVNMVIDDSSGTSSETAVLPDDLTSYFGGGAAPQLSREFMAFFMNIPKENTKKSTKPKKISISQTHSMFDNSIFLNHNPSDNIRECANTFLFNNCSRYTPEQMNSNKSFMYMEPAFLEELYKTVLHVFSIRESYLLSAAPSTDTFNPGVFFPCIGIVKPKGSADHSMVSIDRGDDILVSFNVYEIENFRIRYFSANITGKLNTFRLVKITGTKDDDDEIDSDDDISDDNNDIISNAFDEASSHKDDDEQEDDFEVNKDPPQHNESDNTPFPPPDPQQQQQPSSVADVMGDDDDEINEDPLFDTDNLVPNRYIIQDNIVTKLFPKLKITKNRSSYERILSQYVEIKLPPYFNIAVTDRFRERHDLSAISFVTDFSSFVVQSHESLSECKYRQTWVLLKLWIIKWIKFITTITEHFTKVILLRRDNKTAAADPDPSLIDLCEDLPILGVIGPMYTPNTMRCSPASKLDSIVMAIRNTLEHHFPGKAFDVTHSNYDIELEKVSHKCGKSTLMYSHSQTCVFDIFCKYHSLSASLLDRLNTFIKFIENNILLELDFKEIYAAAASASAPSAEAAASELDDDDSDEIEQRENRKRKRIISSGSYQQQQQEEFDSESDSNCCGGDNDGDEDYTMC